MNALLDKDFLKELDISNNKEIYAQITALDINDYPLELIEGKVTGGSINIDGASALRRTCSVSLIAEKVNINEFYWGLKNKFKLEIGVKNTINSKYPEIIWFSQGVYVITSFNINLSANSYTISINGKDKMCKLNGEFGGSLPASIDFGTEDYYDLKTGTTTQTKIPIKKIIREMIHTYAGEPYHNIVINDLDAMGLELLEYRCDMPLYLMYDVGQEEYNQMSFDGKLSCYLVSNNNLITLDSIPKYNKRIDGLIDDEATKIRLSKNGTIYTVSKIEYGQTAGYRLTELTYAGDLISNPGDSITSILDKIVGMLGNFEYFYNLDGMFVFQTKKTYLNTSWDSVIENAEKESYVENMAFIDKSLYQFNGNNLIKSISNTPNLSNLKNDYIIWGTRKGISGAEIPIHMRYAIHKKPTKYVSYDGKKIYTSNDYDWRELIYQMALDYYKHNQEEDYLIKIAKNNPEYPNGITGYESFYLDFQAFWRDIYNPEGEIYYEVYSYEIDDYQTFIPDKSIGDLYIDENYTLINYNSYNDTAENRNNALYLQTLKGYYSLDNFKDMLPIDSQDYFYYKVSDGIFKRIKKFEINDKCEYDKNIIYIEDLKSGEKIHYIDYDLLDFSKFVYCLKEDSNYVKISEIPSPLQKLYKEGDEYKKYIFHHKDYSYAGEPIGDPEKNYINYFYKVEKFYNNSSAPKEQLKYWNKNVQESPDLINFWIDFLDVDEVEDERSELAKMSISSIGDRPKVINDKNVKSIYYRNVPNIIYAKKEDITAELLKEKSGYVFMNLTEDIFNSDYFSISSQGKSAKDSLDELLYQHSYCTESVNIQSLPIYYLEPNNIISIEDKDTNINGEYILNKITIPLTYNGMMSIQATKSPQRIY